MRIEEVAIICNLIYHQEKSCYYHFLHSILLLMLNLKKCRPVVTNRTVKAIFGAKKAPIKRLILLLSKKKLKSQASSASPIYCTYPSDIPNIIQARDNLLYHPNAQFKHCKLHSMLLLFAFPDNSKICFLEISKTSFQKLNCFPQSVSQTFLY